MEKKVWIPKVPQRTLRRRAKRIRRVVRRMESLYYVKVPAHLGKIPDWEEPDLDGEAVDLEPLCEITTYHDAGFKGYSGPSVAEVLAQISSGLLKETVAFEIVEILREMEHDQVNDQWYYQAVTRLYRRT